MEKLIPELFFSLLKRHQQSYTLFLDLSLFLDGPNLENQAKTQYCRQKSKVPPFLKKRELFTKRWKNDTQSDPERQEKAIKNATGEPLETHSKKTGKKTQKKLEKNLCWHRNGKRVKWRRAAERWSQSCVGYCSGLRPRLRRGLDHASK